MYTPRNNYVRQSYIPDPVATNIPVRRRIVLESALLIPEWVSAFRDFPSWTCLERPDGTRHRCDRLRQPITREYRCEGQTVRSPTSEGRENIDARTSICSTSEYISIIPKLLLWPDMSFLQERRDTTLVSLGFLLFSPQFPPTSFRKEQSSSLTGPDKDIESLRKDDGDGNNNATKQWYHWLKDRK